MTDSFPIGSMGLYPLYVSINIPAPWILWVYKFGFHEIHEIYENRISFIIWMNHFE